MNGERGGELDVEIAGQKVRSRGFRIIDLAWLPIVLGVGYNIMQTQAHSADAEKSSASVAKALIESNAAVAQALRESNAATTAAIREMIAEQKRATEAAREQNCLIAMEQNRRPGAAEFCKRVAR